MNTILEKQEILQALIEAKSVTPCTHFNITTKGELVDYIKNAQYALNQEIVELIEAIGTRDILKPWKQNYSSIVDQPVELTAEIRSEAIDMFCFALNILLAVGITCYNIDEEYEKVRLKNVDRQEGVY